MPYAGTRNAPDPGLGCRPSNRGGFYSKSTESETSCSHGHPTFLKLTAGRVHSSHSPRKSQDRQKRHFDTTCPKSIWPSAMPTCSRGSGAVKNERYFSLKYRDVDFSTLRGEKLQARLVELMETVKQNWAWAWTTSPRDSYEETTRLMESWWQIWNRTSGITLAGSQDLIY